MSIQSLAQVRPAAAPATQRRTIPFDYQCYVPVFDPKDDEKDFVDQIISSTLTISVEAPFVAVSVGYGFVPRVQKFSFGPQFDAPASPGGLRFTDIISSLSEKLG